MDCRQVNEATRFATELYAEAIHVPFMAKFVVFSKRHDPQEAQLRVFCMTDDKEDKTLETQEHFTEVAKSRDVEVLENKPQYLEFAGNLIPVTKSGEQLSLTFQAFRENRVPFNVRIKDLHQEALGRIAFMKEPRGSRTDPPQTPICNLNIALPEFEASKAVSELVTLEKKYGFVEETGLAKPELIHRADLRLSDIARELGRDWEPLGQQLDIPEADIHSIRAECPGDLAQQALLMLRLWMQRAGPRATGNNLEKGLRRINREDIVNKCMFNVELVTDDVEKAVAKVHLDQSGFDTFREELGASRNASLKRDTSLNASYDEPDLMKEAESAEETSSETGSVHEKHGSSEAKARKSKKYDTGPRTSSPDTTQVSTVIRRGSKEATPTIALEESFDDPRVENHVHPVETTVITEPSFIATKESLESPYAPRMLSHDDLLTQGELDELVDGVLYPETKEKEKKKIGPVIVEQRQLSDAPDSIVKVVSVTQRTVTQLPITEEVPAQQATIKLPDSIERKVSGQPDLVSTVVREVQYKSVPEPTGVVSFPPEEEERLECHEAHPAEISYTHQGDTLITTDPKTGRTVTTTTTVQHYEGEPQELGTTYFLSKLPDDQKEGTTHVVRKVTRDVNEDPSEESVITVQTMTTTSASAPGKQQDLSAKLLDDMFGETGKDVQKGGKESPYGKILKPEDIAKLKSKPGIKKEDLELLDQLFPDQGSSKKPYPSEGLVAENVIIPEYRTFVMAEETKKQMSPKKKERVLEKIGRALSHDDQEGRQKPRLMRAATVDSSTLEDEPLAKSMEFRTKPSDDAVVTKTTTEFQDVHDDGTVKHTVTTVTRTTIIQEVDEEPHRAEIPSAPPAADVLQQPGARPGESETWASDLDTSQVSVSSLPEDEKTEPTATLSSATTTTEGVSTSEPGVQTQVEEKEWTETDPDSGDVRRVVCKTTHTTVLSTKPTENHEECWKSAEKAEVPEQTTTQPAASPDNIPSFDRNLPRPEKRSPLLEASPPEETDYNMEQEISPAKEYPDYLTPDMQVSVGVSPTEGLPPNERKYSGGDSSEKSPLPTQKSDEVFVPSSEKILSCAEAQCSVARYSESSLDSSVDVDSPKIPLSEPVMAFENVAFAGEDIIDASSEAPDELTSPCGTRSPYEVVRETASDASIAALIKHSEEKLQKEVHAEMQEKVQVSAPEEWVADVTVTQHDVSELYPDSMELAVDKSPAEIKEGLKELFPGGTDYLTAGLNVVGIIRSPISHKGNSDDEDGEEEQWADRVLSKIKGRPVPPTPPASPRTVQSAVEVKEQVTWEAPVEEHIEGSVEEVKEIPTEEQVIIEHDEDVCKDSSSTPREMTDRDFSPEKSGTRQKTIRKEDVQPHHKRPLLEHIPSEISDEDLVEREQSPTGHPPDTCREWKDDFSSRRDSSPDSDSDKGAGGAVTGGALPSGTSVSVQSTAVRNEEEPSSMGKQDKTGSETATEATVSYVAAAPIKEDLSGPNELSALFQDFQDASKEQDICKVSEQLSSPPEKRSDSDSGKTDIPLVILRNKNKAARRTEKRTSRDFDTQSGSETDQSHYYSFEMTSDSGKTPSRPTSSEFDVNILSGVASSEYDTCATSQDTSYATAHTSSQEASYATARSSLSGSSRESAYSVDSESSGHLGSLEASEASDTIVASAHEDLESDNESQSHSVLKEPYDGSISESVIRGGVEVPFLPNWQCSISDQSSQHVSYAGRIHQRTDDGSSSPFEVILQEAVSEYSSTAVTRSFESTQQHSNSNSSGNRGAGDMMLSSDILNGGVSVPDGHTARDDRMVMSHEEEPLSISESSATQSEHTWHTSVETTVETGQGHRSSCDAERYQRQSTMTDSAVYSLPRDEAMVVGDLADLQAELDDDVDDDATPPFPEINGPVEVDYVPEYDDPYAAGLRERLQQDDQQGAEDNAPVQQEASESHDNRVHREQQDGDMDQSEQTQDDDEQDQGLEEGYYTETFESNLSTEEVEGAVSKDFFIDSRLLIDRPDSEVDIILAEVKDSNYEGSLVKDIELFERPMTPEPPEDIQALESRERKSMGGFRVGLVDHVPMKQGSSDTSPPISESFEFVEKADIMGIPTPNEHFEMVPELCAESQLASLVKEMKIESRPSGEAIYPSQCEEHVTHLHGTYDASSQKDKKTEFISEQIMDVENAKIIGSTLTEESMQQDFPFDLSYQHDYGDSERGDFGELYTHQEVEEEGYDDERYRHRARQLSPASDERVSTPDYDTLAGRKTFGRGSEKDDVSISSLQEFEHLEAEMAAGKSSSVGSSDSFSGRVLHAKNGSEQDSVSINSLTEFERLEKEIVEAESVDGRVRSEVTTRLDEIDEGHESQASDSGFEFTEGRPVGCDQNTIDEIEEIIRQARANVAQLEQSSQDSFAVVTQPSETEHTAVMKDYLVCADDEDILNVEPPPEVESSKLLMSTDFESGRMAKHILDRTASSQSCDNGERRSSASTATNFDTDSLMDRDIDGEDSEANPPSETSAWSLKEKSDLDHDSLHGSQSSAPHDSLQENLSRGEERDSLQEHDQKSGDLDSLQEDNKQDSLHETRDIDQDSFICDHSRCNDQENRQLSPIRTTELSPTLTRGIAAPVVVEQIDTLCWVEQGFSIPQQVILTQTDKVQGDTMISSTDSLEPSSSANTHATYQFETDSVMSSSLNSVHTYCEESTMVSSTDTLDPELCKQTYDLHNSASHHLGMNLAVTMKEMGEKLLEGSTISSSGAPCALSNQQCEQITNTKSYVDEKGNTKPICELRHIPPQEDTRNERPGGDAPPDIEEQFKDYLRRTMSSPIDKEQVEEKKAVDEYGNVTITRMVKRHITSEPQIHAQTFVGSDAEEKTREFLQSFKDIEPSTEKDEYEGFDADGNPIRVIQKVVVRPTVKTVTFSGPNARAQMEEYMRTHSAKEASSAEDTPTSDSGVGACSMSSPPSMTPEPHTCTDLITSTSASLASPGLRNLPDGNQWTECAGLDESGQPITTSRVTTTRTTRTIGPDGQEQVVTTTTTSVAGPDDSEERMRRSMQGVLDNFMRDQGPLQGSYFEENVE